MNLRNLIFLSVALLINISSAFGENPKLIDVHKSLNNNEVCNETANPEALMTTIIYVNAGTPFGGDGTSWVSAYTFLQDALYDSAFGGSNPIEIWIAAGTYYPDDDEGGNVANNDRDASFVLDNARLTLYGGFDGTETSLNQRDWEDNVVILSGDIDQDQLPAQNAYQVLRARLSIVSLDIDGITITKGNANGVGSKTRGGGIQTDVLLNMRNCIISNNRSEGTGGGMQIAAINENIFIENCLFIDNRSGGNGGAIYSTESNLTLVSNAFVDNYSDQSGAGIYNGYGTGVLDISDCLFEGNIAVKNGGAIRFSETTALIGGSIFKSNSGENGGAIALYDSEVEIFNCLFNYNTATDQGGAIRISSSFPIGSPYYKIYNNTISDNQANNGGGLYVNSDYPVEIRNCILWNNSSQLDLNGTGTVGVSHCVIQGGYAAGTDIIDSDPFFSSALLCDFSLTSCSPAIDIGNILIDVGTTDLAGNDRVYNATGSPTATIDIGAYEFQSIYCPGVIYVDNDKPSGGDGSSWSSAYKYLSDALADPLAQTGVANIWVAEGIYYPDEGAGRIDNNRTESFSLVENVSLYGGFSGTEETLGERNWSMQPTILSGDINANGAKKSYHVISFDNISFSILDGFTIRDGNANGFGSNVFGGGMNSVNSSPTIIHCIFKDNSSSQDGGAIYNEGGVPFISNTLFFDNVAFNGGAIYNNNCDATIENSTFYGNLASNRGGGLYNGQSDPTIKGCIFWGNNSQINDDILSTSVASSCIVEGGFVGGSSILNEDPKFVDPTTDDFTLQSCSPAIDAGSKSVTLPVLDLGGNIRTRNARGLSTAIADIGPYEFQSAYTAQCECPDDLDLTGIIDSEIYVADVSISCDGIIPTNETVTFSAGNSFAVFEGAELIIQTTAEVNVILEGCPD